MRRIRQYMIWSLISCIMSVLFISAAVAFSPPHPKTYVPRMNEVYDHKNPIDDPRPIQKNFGPDTVLPKEIWDHLTHDVEVMKAAWSDLVGFKAPDLVGKIAPDIKPGKYSLEDVKNNPGFDELLLPPLKFRLRPAGPPFVCSIQNFEIIPPRQYYWALPISEETKKNIGKTQLDEDGYIKTETWGAGYPFPKPSGKFKGRQLIYNHLSKYSNWGGDQHGYIKGFSFNKNLRIEGENEIEVLGVRSKGRLLFEPYDWISEAAKERLQTRIVAVVYQSPRDIRGLVWHQTYFADPRELDQLLMWLPSYRRIRKQSATDSQDPSPGENATADDSEGFAQKLTPDRFPMKFDIIDEREYLTVALQTTGDEYVDSTDGYAMKNIKLERRPFYVIQVTELDPNYVYSKRIIYMDKETFFIPVTDCYDQKDRLYRSIWWHQSFIPEAGMIANVGGYFIATDYVDEQSNFSVEWNIPAAYPPDDVSLKGVMKLAK